MTGLRGQLLATVAGQLGRPHGVVGRGVALLLNRGNRRAVAAAAEAAARTGNAVADIGFGGGLGLRVLLQLVGRHGTVYGVELSDDMLSRARAQFATHIAAGSMKLLHGSLTGLPIGDKSLDAAITVNTLYFVDDLDAACAELFRVLRVGGLAVVGIGDPDAMARLPFTAYGFKLRPVRDVVAALRNAGFGQVDDRRLDAAVPHHLLIAHA